MLNEVEIGGGNVRERDFLVARDRDRFQENFRQYYRRTPVEIGAAAVHPGNQRAKEAEIVVRAKPKRRAISHGMHVRNVRADREMHGHRDFALKGLQ